MLQLAAEDKLQLSDTVEEHLPELVERFPQLRGRTVRQLLSMRSGLPDFYDRWVEELAREPTRTVPPERVIELALRDPVSAPGTSEYSNTNYILLGEIAESVTGTPLRALIAQRFGLYGLGIHGVQFPGDWVGHFGGLAGWQLLLFHNLSTGATVAIVATTCRSDFHIAETLWLLYPR